MRHRSLLLLCAATLLGLLWPGQGATPLGTIRVIPVDLGEPILGAREPAILMPGPRLRWTAGEQPVGRVRRGAAWIEEQARDGSFQWRSGILSPAPPFPGITAVSASSLRNGVRRDDQGRIVGWSPQQVRSADGQLHLVEDRFRDGSFDVIYVEPGGGAPVAVASSERFEAHASLALDGLDRVWVAWDEGRSNWGRGNGLHEQRALRLVMRDAEGWHEVPLPTLEVLVGESNSAPSP
ncbi:MAG: hypothetical protein O3A95_10565, partial [Planctomycetota bacterium]|nr:hypothetical protein [Planctomycetota bacterium]